MSWGLGSGRWEVGVGSWELGGSRLLVGVIYWVRRDERGYKELGWR